MHTVYAAVAFYQVCVKQIIIPYHQLMTPKWIKNYAIITGPHTFQPQYFDILPTTGVDWQRALQVQLVPPGVLTPNDSVTVSITVAMDTALADSADNDASIGISDGMSFVGLIFPDRFNYHELSPCRQIEADNSAGYFNNVIQINGPLVASRKYSSEAKLQIRPTEKWGSCHTEHDGGFTIIANYQRTLDLTKGFYFEFHRHQNAERYRIKYIAIDVELD